MKPKDREKLAKLEANRSRRDKRSSMRFKIEELPDWYAQQFRANLVRDRVSKNGFFVMCLRAYVDNEPAFMDFLHEYRDSLGTIKKRHILQVARAKKLTNTTEEQFVFSEEQKNEIYDLIENGDDYE